MKKVFIFLLSILGIFVVLFLIGIFLPEEENLEPGTVIHKDFRVIIPSEWEEYEGSNLGYIYFTYLPPNENPQSENAEFVFISVGNIGEEIEYSLEELLEAGLENSKTTMPDLELQSNVEREANNFTGREIKFTGTSEGVLREFVQFFGLKFGNIYTITYTCPINNCHYYSDYDSIIESFEPVEAKKK
jgi:hypothetical protein